MRVALKRTPAGILALLGLVLSLALLSVSAAHAGPADEIAGDLVECLSDSADDFVECWTDGGKTKKTLCTLRYAADGILCGAAAIGDVVRILTGVVKK